MGLNRDFEFTLSPITYFFGVPTNSELSLQVSNFEGGFRIFLELLQLSRSPLSGLICGGFHDRVFTSSMVKTHQECGKSLLRMSVVGNLGLTRLNFELFPFPLTLPSLSLKFSRSCSTYKHDRRVTWDSKF